MATKAEIAAEILRRRRCRESLHAYALSVPIPTVPGDPPKIDETIMGPSRMYMAAHHAMIYDVLERTMMRSMGRCLIMAPPGVAKSICTSVVAPTWYMGKFPGSRIIATSYTDDLAETNSKRCIQLCDEPDYKALWPEEPTVETRAVSKWNLSNESAMIARGLTSGITGNRANGILVDDPVKGREDADSPQMRKKTLDEYKDAVLTRLLPHAWVMVIMTRWSELDLAGEAILPENYKGESGMIKGRDGQMWEVLNLQAKCELVDDPLGRKLGEYIWPEYYPIEHWLQFENAPGMESARTWGSLYQQRPAAQGSGRFTLEMFRYYDGADELPQRMAKLGASDHAVTEGGGDFSEAGVFGMDPAGNLYMLDWWNGQVDPDKSCGTVLDIVERHKIPMWFNEGGNIDKVMRPLYMREIRDRVKKGKRAYVDIRAIPSIKDKIAKVASFQGRCASGMVFFPKRNPHTARIIQQLISMPGGRYDDAGDVCGLIGRALDQFHPRDFAAADRKKSVKPFTGEWLEAADESDKPAVRWR